MVPFKARFPGHVGGVIDSQVEQLQEGAPDSKRDEFSYVSCRGVSPSIGPAPALWNRNNGDQVQIRQGAFQCGVHSKEMATEKIAPLLLPDLDEPTGRARGEMNRIACLQTVSAQVEREAVGANRSFA